MSILLTANGKTQNQSAWARELCISPTGIYDRRKRGLSDEECLTPHHLSKGKTWEKFIHLML